MIIRSFLIALGFASVTTIACAQNASRDPRVRVEPYVGDQIVPIEGHLGYQMMVQFAPDERIENVSIGDSLGWQVTPNHAATLLFLKPLEPHAATNMTVVTTRRSYAFALSVGRAMRPDDPNLTYSLRFSYPDENATDPAAGANFSFAYTTTGARALTPQRVFDDGRFTYFQLRDGAPTPAIFTLGATGEEEVVNSQVRGDYTVVDQVADGFVLRYGRERVIVRRSDAAPAADAASHSEPRLPGRAR